MIAIRVFDPAMCCSTGVCGPAIDPALVRFAADLDWLKSRGVSVERFNLSQQPGAFAENPAVKAALELKGEASLPIVAVNGDVKCSGVYASRDTLAVWAGLTAAAADREEPIAKSGSCCVPRENGSLISSSNGCCGPAAASAEPKTSGCC